MARDLKPGDVVRTLGGSLALKSTEPAGTAPVFNLDVAANRDYFVGERGLPGLRLQRRPARRPAVRRLCRAVKQS